MRASVLMLSAVVVSASAFAAPVSSRAATVTLGLISKQIAPNDPAGTWELWAWTSSGDNDGLMYYAVEFAGENVVGVHDSPVYQGIGGVGGFGGFSSGRQPIPDPGYGNILAASQNPSAFDSLYGVGNPDIPGRIPLPTIDPPFQLNQRWWENPSFASSPLDPEHPMAGDNPFVVPAGAVRLGFGTTSRFDTLEFGETMLTGVFSLGTAGGGTRTEGAETFLQLDHVPAVPEPAAVALSCLAAGCAIGTATRYRGK